MDQKAFVPQDSGRRQPSDVLLIIGHHAAPESVVDHALPACHGLFQPQILHRGRLRQIVERHVDQRSVAARGRRVCRRPEAFPFRPARFVDVHVAIDQSGKHVPVAGIHNFRAFRPSVKRPDHGNLAISDFERRRLDAARKNNAP
jgi:hypothetical protein